MEHSKISKCLFNNITLTEQGRTNLFTKANLETGAIADGQTEQRVQQKLKGSIFE